MYRTICTELWTDPEIKGLDVPTKLLFLYLVTNPHTHLSGIYYCPSDMIMKETGLKPIPYRYGIDTLSKLKKAYADDRTETVFVTNMFEYQGQGPKNEASASKHLETLHNSSLIPLFLARYPQIPYRYPIQSCPSVPDPVLLVSSSSDSDIKSKTYSNGKRSLKPISDTDAPTDKHRDLAAQLKIDLGPEWAKFKNYCLANDRRFANFEAAFRNWIVRASELKGERRVL